MLFYLLSLAGLAPIVVGIEPAVAPVPRACTTRSGTRLRPKRVISSRTDGSLASPARARRSSACSGCRAPDSYRTALRIVKTGRPSVIEFLLKSPRHIGQPVCSM